MSLRTIKDKLHYFLVQKNDAICNEYVDYRNKNEEKHLNERYKTWILILKLNLKYRILRNQPPKIQNKRRVKLPYLDGAESEVYKRPSEYHFAKSLLQYDVISFDIFDTLILRPFAKPVDLFMIVGHRLKCPNFITIRRNAEREARDLSIAQKGTNEINIYDIYEIIERKTGIDKDYGVNVELEAEMEFCFANPYMMRVYKILQEQGKDIIITSDMYLPHILMEKLLEKCGYTGYKQLYVSCDYKCSKHSGELYVNVINNIEKGKKIVHIGDNYKSDIESATKYGIDTKYYKNVHEIGNQYRADGMSALIGSTYSGIVNTHLHNGSKKYNPYYEYGFIYGGLYVLGYCNWIYEKAKKEGIEKILFLSRDGAIYKRVFDTMYDDMPNEYVYWSRIANSKYASKFQKSDIIEKLIVHRTLDHLGLIKITIDDLLNDFDLHKMKKYLKDYDLRGDMVIQSQIRSLLCNMFMDHWDIFTENYSVQKELQRQYFKNILKGCKKVAVVDVGWLGTGPLGIKELIEEEWELDCKVSCFLVGHKHGVAGSIESFELDNTIESYIFSNSKNRLCYDIHTNRKTSSVNTMCFELLTQDNSPSFEGIDDNNNYLFEIPEVENYKFIEEIHNGIFEFVRIYVSKFGKEKYLLNISGYDAYCSFRMITRDFSLISKYFNKFKFSRSVKGDSKNQTFETIGEILVKNNL